MFKTIKLLTAALFLTALLSCHKKVVSNMDTTIFKATLIGASETPPNPSTATGTSTLTYNSSTKTFTDVTSYSGLMPIAGHIHKGVVGVAGPVIFPFTDLTSPITLNSPVLTDEQITALLNDSMYVNLHTQAYPGGEIRGQLIKQ